MSSKFMRKIPTRMGLYEPTGEAAKTEKAIDILVTVKNEILANIKKIQNNSTALPPKEFEEIISYLRKIPMENNYTLNIKRHVTEAITKKDAGEQIQYLETALYSIKTEINRLAELFKTLDHKQEKEPNRSNTGIFATLVALSSIPAFLTIGRGITGMAVSDTASPAADTVGTTLVGVYFFIAFAVLTLAVIYTILLFTNKTKKILTEDKSQKTASNHKPEHHRPQPNPAARLTSEDAAKYMLAIVAFVGIIAIIVLVI